MLRHGAHVDLLALAPHLYQPLHRALAVPEVADTWRPRGRLVPSYEWERFLLDGLHLGAVVRTAVDHRLVGLVELRDLQPTDQHAYLDVAAVPEYIGSGLVVEGVAQLLDEAFARGGLHKVYALLSEDSRARTESALDGLLTEEAVLRGHVVLQGRRQDVTVASITHDEFRQRLGERPDLARCSPTWRMAALPIAGVDRSLTDILGEVTGRPAGEVTADTPLRGAELDSMLALELLVAVEAAAGREMPEDLLASVDTVGELLGWVEALR